MDDRDNLLDPASPREALDLCGDVDLDDAGRALLREGMNARRAVEVLREEGLLLDAIRVVARALPRHEAVRWAHRCAASGAGGAARPGEVACLEVVAAWLAEPTEEHRAAAAAAVGRTDYDSPGAWVAAAAGWTGGSLAPVDLPPVPPPPSLSAHAIAGAVGLAAARDPDTVEARQNEFIDLALDSTGGAAAAGATPGATVEAPRAARGGQGSQ